MISDIKQIIEDIGLTYYRSLNLKDLSQIAITNKIDTIGVLAGTINIDGTVTESTGSILEMWDVTILFLVLSPSIDATAEQIDNLLDPLYLKAHEFLNLIVETFPMAYFLEDYTLNSTEAINITTEVMAGWELNLKIPIKKMLCSS